MLIYNEVTFHHPELEVFELRILADGKNIVECRRTGSIWAESILDLMSCFSIPDRGGDNPEGLSDITG